MTVQFLNGDVFKMLATIESESVDCVVTSPPYWGLRDYGVEGQIGLEPSLGEHLDVMVAVFREIHRVLKPTGTLWLNYGDCYAAKPSGRSAATIKSLGVDDRAFQDKPFSTIGPIYDKGYATARGKFKSGGRQSHHDHGGRVVAGGMLKAKDLCMIPNRLAIALQDDGWYVRSEIVWHKPNPMPESAKDRPTSAHEKVFLLTKSARYFYDADAIREKRAGDEDANTFRGGSYTEGEPGPRKATGNKRVKIPGGWDTAAGSHGSVNRQGRTSAQYRERGHTNPHNGFNNDWDNRSLAEQQAQGANARNVWTIATQPFGEAHFATMPEALAERCILAGSPSGGVVLDPFGGAGTVGLVAHRLMRSAILIELNPEYCAIAQRRLKIALVPLKGAVNDRLSAGPLFDGEAA